MQQDYGIRKEASWTYPVP